MSTVLYHLDWVVSVATGPSGGQRRSPHSPTTLNWLWYNRAHWQHCTDPAWTQHKFGSSIMTTPTSFKEFWWKASLRKGNFPRGKFNVTPAASVVGELECWSNAWQEILMPVATVNKAQRCAGKSRHHPSPNCPFQWGDQNPHLIHGSLGPSKTTPQMAFWFVRPFLQGLRTWSTYRPHYINTCRGIALIGALWPPIWSGLEKHLLTYLLTYLARLAVLAIWANNNSNNNYDFVLSSWQSHC